MSDIFAQKLQVQHFAWVIPITIFPRGQLYVYPFPGEPEVVPDGLNNPLAAFALFRVSLNR